MPTSKKRVKKQHPEEAPKSRNIVKSKTGKVILVVLALSFVFSGVALLIATLIEAMQ